MFVFARIVNLKLICVNHIFHDAEMTISIIFQTLIAVLFTKIDYIIEVHVYLYQALFSLMVIKQVPKKFSLWLSANMP